MFGGQKSYPVGIFFGARGSYSAVLGVEPPNSRFNTWLTMLLHIDLRTAPIIPSRSSSLSTNSLKLYRSANEGDV